MTRVWKQLAGFLVVVTAILGSGATVDAAPWWPLPPRTDRIWGGEFRGDGAFWCGDIFNGSYGGVFFAITEIRVNYGGSCNALWGQPAGWIVSKADRYVNGFLHGSSGYAYSSSNASSVQANVAFAEPAGTTNLVFNMQGWGWDPVKGDWRTNFAPGRGGNV